MPISSHNGLTPQLRQRLEQTTRSISAAAQKARLQQDLKYCVKLSASKLCWSRETEANSPTPFYLASKHLRAVAELGKGHPRLAGAPVVVVVELVEVAPVDAPPPPGVEGGPRVLEGVEVLGGKGHELLEVGIGLGTRPKLSCLHRSALAFTVGKPTTRGKRNGAHSLEVLEHPREVLRARGEKRPLHVGEVVPVEAVEPRVPDHLREAVLELGAAVGAAPYARFGAREEAGEEVDALGRELRADLPRDL